MAGKHGLCCGPCSVCTGTAAAAMQAVISGLQAGGTPPPIVTTPPVTITDLNTTLSLFVTFGARIPTVFITDYTVDGAWCTWQSFEESYSAGGGLMTRTCYATIYQNDTGGVSLYRKMEIGESSFPDNVTNIAIYEAIDVVEAASLTTPCGELDVSTDELPHTGDLGAGGVGVGPGRLWHDGPAVMRVQAAP